VDGGALLGLKMHMDAPTKFSKTYTARPAEFASPKQEFLMIGDDRKYSMLAIPWGESTVFKPFPTGWALRGM
jgi:hypothetical protein